MRLSYYWLPLLETAKKMVQSPDSNYDDAIAGIRSNIEKTCEKSMTAGFSQEQITLAQFALVAAIDEMAISQDWQGTEAWTRKPLQLLYFSTTRAGAEFFQKIDALDSDDTEVREVYALVLLNGYTGIYRSPEAEQLKEYRENLFNQLIQERDIAPLETDAKIFPAATMPLDDTPVYLKKRINSTHVALLILGVPLLCLAGMYFYYNHHINNVAAEKIKIVSPIYPTKTQ